MWMMNLSLKKLSDRWVGTKKKGRGKGLLPMHQISAWTQTKKIKISRKKECVETPETYNINFLMEKNQSSFGIDRQVSFEDEG